MTRLPANIGYSVILPEEKNRSNLVNNRDWQKKARLIVKSNVNRTHYKIYVKDKKINRKI